MATARVAPTILQFFTGEWITIHDLKNKGIRARLGTMLATKGNLINKGCNGKAVRVILQLTSADLCGLID
jgi:hypothetical protein